MARGGGGRLTSHEFMPRVLVSIFIKDVYPFLRFHDADLKTIFGKAPTICYIILIIMIIIRRIIIQYTYIYTLRIQTPP